MLAVVIWPPLGFCRIMRSIQGGGGAKAGEPPVLGVETRHSPIWGSTGHPTAYNFEDAIRHLHTGARAHASSQLQNTYK